jgi:hypothetical protein
MANLPHSNRYQKTGRNKVASEPAPSHSTSRRQRHASPGRQQPAPQRVWDNNAPTNTHPVSSAWLWLLILPALVMFPIPTLVILAVLIGSWLWAKQ